MDEAGTQPAENACVSQNGFVVLAKIEKPYTCGSVFRQPWFLIPLFALAGCFLTLCHRFSLDSFAKWACRRSCFLQHARLSVFGTWAPPHCCGSWLRPGLLPPIGFSFPLFLFCVLLPCPSAFGSLWAGNQVTGVTGDGGYRGAGMRWGSITRQMGWLTRRRGRCPRTPARDSSPLDPRQGGMAPLGTAILAGA